MRTLKLGRPGAFPVAAIFAAFVCALALLAPVHADSLNQDFEGFTAGSPNGQAGWQISGGFDVEIVEDHVAAPDSFGSRSLRISNAVTSGSFGDQLFSAALTDEAGESSALNAGQSGGTRQNFFAAEWSFASTTPDAQQSGLSVSVSPDRGDGARMSYIRMFDAPEGLGVEFYDVQGTGEPANFVPTTVASGLDRSLPHTVRLEMTFVDGPDNDQVAVYVDGALVHEGGSWENYFLFDSESQAEGVGSRTVDSLIFLARGAAQAALDEQGFLIDGVSISSSTVAAPIGPDVCPVGCSFDSIQDAIDAASPGDSIVVGAGTYTEALTIGASLTLQGAGDDLGSGTVLEVDGGGSAVTVSADEVTLSGLRIEKGDGEGRGIEVSGATVNDLTISGVTVTGANVGLRVGSGTTIDGLTVSDSHFDGNTFGWYLAKETAASAAATVTNVSVTNTTFDNNLRKGIYAEKLENALFDGGSANNSGTDATYSVNNGVDINLKFGDYENIEFRNFSAVGSGTEGSGQPFDPAAITIKARDDGATYSAPPATLSGVTLTNVTVSGGVVGVRFGEPGKDNAGPTGVTVVNSSLSGTGGVALDNQTQATVTATSNWWGSASGPSGGQVVGDVDVSNHCVQADCTTPPPPPVEEPTPTPTPPPTVEEDGGVEVEVEVVEEVEVIPDEPVELEVVSSSGSSASVKAPAGALPEGSKVTVAAVAEPEKLLEQAPPPPSAQVALAFSVKAESATGEAIEEGFAAPVQLEFEVPASAAPEGATTSEMVVAFWNGSEWIEVDAIVTVNEDGSLSISASVDHFTLFAVFHQEGRGTFSGPLFEGVTLSVWRGGPLALMVGAVPDATSFWVTHEGKFFSYVPAGPDWVNEAFLALFPGGRIPASTPMFVVR